jgi:hypothetical protein
MSNVTLVLLLRDLFRKILFEAIFFLRWNARGVGSLMPGTTDANNDSS